MTNEWKDGLPPVGEECEITVLGTGGLFRNCKILYIDSMSVVFSSSAASSMPRYLSEVEFRPIKAPAEIVFAYELADLLQKHNVYLASKVTNETNSSIHFQTKGNPDLFPNMKRCHMGAYDLRCEAGMSSTEANNLHTAKEGTLHDKKVKPISHCLLAGYINEFAMTLSTFKALVRDGYIIGAEDD